MSSKDYRSTLHPKRQPRKKGGFYVQLYTNIPKQIEERLGLVAGAKLLHHITVPYKDGKPVPGAVPTGWQVHIDQKSVRICSKCSVTNQLSASFCLNCGEPLGGEPS